MLHTLKINTSELEVGMFVSGLDRPWLETPFIMQGFCVGSAEEIERLRNYCSYVFVDFAKSRNKDHPLLKRIRAVSTAVPIADIFPGRPLKPYPTTSEWKEESAQAWLVLDSLVDFRARQ